MTTLAQRALDVLEQSEEEIRQQNAEQHKAEIAGSQKAASDHFSKVLGGLLYGEQIGPDVWEVVRTWSVEDERMEAYATIGGMRFMFEMRDDYYGTMRTLYLLDTCPRCSVTAAKEVRIEQETDLGRALKSDRFIKHRLPGSETEAGWVTYCDGENQVAQRGETVKPEEPEFPVSEAERALLGSLRALFNEYLLSVGEIT